MQIIFFNFFSNITTYYLFIFLQKKICLYAYAIFLLLQNCFMDTVFHNTSINIALLNAMSIFHPFLLFMYFHTFLSIFKKKIVFKGIVVEKFINSSSLIVVLTTFILGSYWSAQELLWGGFWNWDFVELTLLLLFLNHLIFTHVWSKYSSYLLTTFIKITILTLFLYIIINRTSIFSSQHTFSSSFFFSININYIVCVFVWLIILLFFYIWKKSINYSSCIFTPIFLSYFLFFFLIIYSNLLFKTELITTNLFKYISYFVAFYVVQINKYCVVFDVFIYLFIFYFCTFFKVFSLKFTNIIHNISLLVLCSVTLLSVSITVYSTKIIYSNTNILLLINGLVYSQDILIIRENVNLVLFFFINCYNNYTIFFNLLSNYSFFTFYYYTFGFSNIIILFLLSKVIIYLNTKNSLNMCI